MLLAAAHPGSTFSICCGARRIMYAWQARLTSEATAALKPRIEAMPGKGLPVRSRMACDPVGRAAPCMGWRYRPTGPDRWLVTRWAELAPEPGISCRSNEKKCSARQGVGRQVTLGPCNRDRGVVQQYCTPGLWDNYRSGRGCIAWQGQWLHGRSWVYIYACRQVKPPASMCLLFCCCSYWCCCCS